MDLNLLSDEKSIEWINLSNVLFIIDDYSEFKTCEYDDIFKKTFKCADVEDRKGVSIEEFVSTRTDIPRFIINSKIPNIKAIIINKEEKQFIPIIVTFNHKKVFKNIIGMPIKFVGWFWNNHFHRKLHKIGQECLKQLLALDQVKDELMSALCVDNLEEYWVKQKQRLHVVTKFIGGQMTEEVKEYLNKVSQMFHITTKAKVTGFLLTPRTFTGHVDLENDSKWLFDPHEKEFFKLLPHVILAEAPNLVTNQSGLDQLAVQIMMKEGKLPKKTYKMQSGDLQDWDDGQFYLVLKKPLEYNLMFLMEFSY